MLLKLSELQKKDIINISNGKKVGNIVDINITDDGLIESIILERNTLFNFFSSGDEVKIFFKDIEKIGEDVIIVKLENM